MTNTTCHFSISLDGFMAGPGQDRDNPLGAGGLRLHEWHLTSDPTEADAALTAELLRPRGAFVMGRNMFGPIRGEWDEDWRGWWGDEPPYHAPVFVLTHYAHDPIEMAGGTTFHFVTDGFDAAYAQAQAVAGDRDISIAGGASTVRQALAAGVITELVAGHRARRARRGRVSVHRHGGPVARADRGDPFTPRVARPLPRGRRELTGGEHGALRVADERGARPLRVLGRQHLGAELLRG